MFDREYLNGSTVDLNAGDLWDRLVQSARISRDLARELQAELDDSSGPNYDRFGFETVVNLREHHRTAGLAVARVMSGCVESRTWRERSEAVRKVTSGRCRLVPLACSGEVCVDCTYPLWWHISDGGRILCPMGREYWTLLRAVRDALNETGIRSHHMQDGLHETVRMIARETRRTA